MTIRNALKNETKAHVTADESPEELKVTSSLNRKTTDRVELHPNMMASMNMNHSSTKLSQQSAKFAAYEKMMVTETRSLYRKLSEYFSAYKLRLFRKPTLK